MSCFPFFLQLCSGVIFSSWLLIRKWVCMLTAWLFDLVHILGWFFSSRLFIAFYADLHWTVELYRYLGIAHVSQGVPRPFIQESLKEKQCGINKSIHLLGFSYNVSSLIELLYKQTVDRICVLINRATQRPSHFCFCSSFPHPSHPNLCLLHF